MTSEIWSLLQVTDGHESSASSAAWTEEPTPQPTGPPPEDFSIYFFFGSIFFRIFFALLATDFISLST